MLKVKVRKYISFYFGLLYFLMFLSCMSTAERERLEAERERLEAEQEMRRQAERERQEIIRQRILEGRNIDTGLFDEIYSGRSFQEKEDLEEFKTTDEFQRAFENYQRFLTIRSEHQVQIDEQNRVIALENVEIDRRNVEINRRNDEINWRNAEADRMLAERNAEIDRRNREIDREIEFFRNRANREFEDWKYNELRKFNINPIIGSAFIDGNSYSSFFHLTPTYQRGIIISFSATGRITENGRVVFDQRRSWFPDRPFPDKQQREQRGLREPLVPRIPRRASVQNTLQYNPNVLY